MYNWNELEPDDSASGCIVAWKAGVRYDKVYMYYLADGKSEFRHYPDHKSVEYISGFDKWCWSGPPVPSVEQQGKSIITWKFYDAPGELRALSTNGGDEDWLTILPDDDEPSWMGYGGAYGCCCVNTYDLGDGRFVKIGCHA